MPKHLFQKGYTPWNKGIPCPEETRGKISLIQIGRKLSESTKNKMRTSAKRGKDNRFWKGGLMQDREYQLNMVNVYSANRRARKRNAVGSFTIEEWNNKKEEFNYTCPFCHRKEPQVKLTKDHIIPLSAGGSNFISNIQPLCFSCNSKKQQKIIDFKKEVGKWKLN